MPQGAEFIQDAAQRPDVPAERTCIKVRTRPQLHAGVLQPKRLWEPAFQVIADIVFSLGHPGGVRDADVFVLS